MTEIEKRMLRARNPRNGAIDYQFEAPTEQTLRAMISELRAHQPAWRAMGPAARAAALGRLQDEIEKRRDALFSALSADTGRRAIAAQEISALLSMMQRWRADAPNLLEQSEAPSRFFPDIAIRQDGEPYPIVGAISPWNFPLLLSFIDAIPALLAGCAVFIKPSDVTPRFVDPLNEALSAAPEVSRVLKIRAGDGAVGAALTPLVDAVAFTGSVKTGRIVGEACARAFIPAFLELGGKDPALVLEGADLERAATAILRASVVSTGQACQSIERVYVARPIFDEFVALIVEKAKAAPLATGDGGIIGPLIFSQQAETIKAHIDDALAKGAVLHCGGVIETHHGGLWVAPTVMTKVTHEMALMTEETFGPVIPVMAFDTADEAVRLANDTVFGLSAAVFAGSEKEALAVAGRLESGGVSINDAGLTTMVFEAEKNGFKMSGMGPSRMGATGLARFLRRKAIYINRGAVTPIEAFAEKS
jgi:acyl-CoA reductase-like NAD-dependent aldehyde dehydrogenase